MKDLFERTVPTYSVRFASDLSVPRVNQTRFGLRNINCEGPVIWNHLPNNIKSGDSLILSSLFTV